MIATSPPRRPRPDRARTRQNAGVVTRASTLGSAFRYAFAGIRYLLWTQRNAKIHCAIGGIAITFGFLLQITRGEWLALLIMMALVLSLEGINTAIEATVDLATPAHHPLAKIAKDVAAGTVLLAALAAVIVGLIIFLPRLLPLILRWLA